MSAENCGLQDAGSARYLPPAAMYEVSGDQIAKCNAETPHLLRPLSIWRMVAATDTDSLWNGGHPIDDSDLYRKQQIEDELAGDW